MDYFTRIIPELSKLFGENSPAEGYHWLQAVYLFGSTLTLSGADEYSDIDIAVFIEKNELNELDCESKIKSTAGTTDIDSEILRHVEFHIYDIAELEQPSRFVEKEILERGLLLYWKPQLRFNEVRNLLSVSICPKCKRCSIDCSCVREPFSHITESLFIFDTRRFQVINDVNYILRELKQQARLGHRDQLELVLVMWYTFYEYLLNNIKYRIIDRIDSSQETDIQRLAYQYEKRRGEFFRNISDTEWKDVKKNALKLMSVKNKDNDSIEFYKRLAQALEYRNSYIHGRAAYLNGELVNPREVNSFCLKTITDELFLFAPTVDFIVSIYRLFNPPHNKAEIGKELGFRFPELKMDFDISKKRRN